MTSADPVFEGGSGDGSRAGKRTKLDEYHLGLIWSGLRDARVYADYFAKLSSRYARFASRVRSISGLLCLGSASTLFSNSDLAAVAAPMLAAFAGAVTMWDILWKISEKSRDVRDLQLDWGRLAIRYLSLWGMVHAPTAERDLLDLEERRAVLMQRHSDLTHSTGWAKRQLKISAEDVNCRLSPRRASTSTE